VGDEHAKWHIHKRNKISRKVTGLYTGVAQVGLMTLNTIAREGSDQPS